MGNIVLLDDLTINKIAAGEVIERPANVVKELVENSIDAGATKVIIEIKKGGKTLIKIQDNGKGIAEDDIGLSIERHATSKIRKVEDLENTYTMGFRGEALASITSISKTTIITKTKDAKTATKVYIEGGNIISGDECTSNVGTTIIVEDLFYNVPVRYKFLKQDQTESRYVKEWIEKFAIAHPSVSLRLTIDGKNAFFSNGNGNMKDIIYTLYGKGVMPYLVDVNYSENDIKISGVVGNTFLAEKTRKNQLVFLNGRNIKNSLLLSSADQAFKGATGIGKFGFFIICIDMPASLYDVNVHPTKTEVRFKDEDIIYKIVYRAIKGALLEKDFLGNEENIDKDKKETYINNEFNFLTSNYDKEKKSHLEVKDQASDNSYIIRNKINQNQDSFIINKSNNVEETAGNDLILRGDKRKIDYKFIGISFKTYIIVEINNEIYLIDQHAAHERLLYEQIKNNYKKNLQNNIQMMLIPEIIELTHKEAEFVKENIEFFKNVGFDIDFFGETTLKINGVPDIEYREKVNNKDMFMDILDEMINNTRSPIKDIEERFVATVACKAAVKAGMDLTKMEVDNLVQNLLVLQNPYTCPHGRPTTIKLNREDMSMKFF